MSPCSLSLSPKTESSLNGGGPPSPETPTEAQLFYPPHSFQAPAPSGPPGAVLLEIPAAKTLKRWFPWLRAECASMLLSNQPPSRCQLQPGMSISTLGRASWGVPRTTGPQGCGRGQPGKMAHKGSVHSNGKPWGQGQIQVHSDSGCAIYQLCCLEQVSESL